MFLLAMLLAASAPTPVAPPPSRLDADAAAVARAGAALEPHVEGTWLDGKAGSDVLAVAERQAVQRWAADWLDLHPRTNATALVEASKRFGDNLSISAARLAHGDMLVAASGYFAGDVFILGVDERGVHRLRWSIAAPQRRLSGAADRALSLWRPAVQNRACRRCQMMMPASVGRLPDAVDGTTRFWIKAIYAREVSETGEEQLSLWSWRNGRAQPLLLDDLIATIEQGPPVVRGHTLHVPVKRHWRSLSDCGSCFGRETDQRYTIGPRGVRALGPVSRTPELDLVDRVYARVLGRHPVGTLAAPSALDLIRRQLRDRLAEKNPVLKMYIGIVTGWKRWRTHGQRWVCVSTYETGALAFAFDDNIRQITSARLLAANACRGKDTRS